jgi:hypothetical protein
VLEWHVSVTHPPYNVCSQLGQNSGDARSCPVFTLLLPFHSILDAPTVSLAWAGQHLQAGQQAHALLQEALPLLRQALALLGQALV